MERRRGKRVLIRAAVEILAHQLLGCGIEDRADRHVRRGEVVGFIDPAGDTEVAQQNSLLAFAWDRSA